jgi:hypothetical protein
MSVNLEDPRNKASSFARPPRLAGAVLLSLGLLIVIISFVGSDLSPVVRIVGSAMALVGLLTLGFGLLIQVANKSPRQGQDGPSA